MQKFNKKNFDASVHEIIINRLNVANDPQKKPWKSLEGQQTTVAKNDPPNYVLGDLHGNAMKLLLFLAVTGQVKFNRSQYGKLLKTYNNKKREEFALILNKLSWNQAPWAKLILAGDTLADRGNSDYMTLLIYQKMHEHRIPFTVIFSNHDSFPLYCYLTDNYEYESWFNPAASWDYAYLP